MCACVWGIVCNGLRQDVLVWWLTGRLIGKQTSKERHANREIKTARERHRQIETDRNREGER